MVTARQAHALAHPLNHAEDALRDEFRADDVHPSGLLLRTILAVDR